MEICFRILQLFLMFGIYDMYNAANILAFIPAPFRSHVKGFQPLLESLALKGHNVTVTTAFPISDPPKNYHQIVVENVLGNFDFNRFQVNEAYKFVAMPIMMWEICVPLTEKVLKLPEIQSLIHSKDNSFDLVLVEIFYQEALIAIGHKFNAPTIVLAPVLFPSSNKWIGNPYNPSYIPDIRLPYVGRMSFIERLKNSVIVFIQTWLEELIYIPKQEALANKYFNYTESHDRPSLIRMLKNISFTLVHSDSILFQQYPTAPNFAEMSGMHIRHQELPQDLKKIMDEASHGIIYFSLGSHVDFNYLPIERINLLFKAFEKLPQKVLFKSELRENIEIPENVIIRKWLPQIAILGHPNCKLFITHGGLHSLMETVHFGIPILGFPLFADQETNMKHASAKGYGIPANFYQFTVDSLLNDIDTLINGSIYREGAKKISKLYHDKPIPPLQTAIYWIEYVIRHKGAHHLKPATFNLEWYQLYLLDVIGFLFISILLVATLLIYIFKLIYKLFKYLNSSLLRKLKQA